LVDIFDEVDRDYLGPAGYTESPFGWLNRSARPEADEGRERIERLYAAFPDANGTLRSALRAGNRLDADNSFYGAMGSLHVFKHLGVSTDRVRADEQVGGSGRRPDLQILDSSGDVEFTVEVTALCERPEWAKSDWFLGQLVDELDNYMVKETYELAVHPVGIWEEPFPSEDVIELLTKRISELPSPAEAARLYEETGAVHEVEIRTGDQKAMVEFLPLHEDKVRALTPEKRGRIVRSTLGAGGVVNATRRIRNKLQKKRAKRYPAELHTTDRPYVIALMNVDHYADVEDVVDALFGAVEVTYNSNGEHRLSRNNEGYWTGENAEENVTQSGVLFVDKFAQSQYFPDRPVTYYIANPFAMNPIDPGLLKADYRLLPNNGRMEWDPPLPEPGRGE
jgi:hypothetical protein